VTLSRHCTDQRRDFGKGKIYVMECVMAEREVNGYVILQDVAEKLLNEKELLATLSYPAKRVLYAGRTTGKWYTKSKGTYDEIMLVYRKMDAGKNTRNASKASKASSKGAVNASSFGVTEEELQRFVALLEKLLIRKG